MQPAGADQGGLQQPSQGGGSSVVVGRGLSPRKWPPSSTSRGARAPPGATRPRPAPAAVATSRAAKSILIIYGAASAGLGRRRALTGCPLH